MFGGEREPENLQPTTPSSEGPHRCPVAPHDGQAVDGLPTPPQPVRTRGRRLARPEDSKGSLLRPEQRLLILDTWR